MEMKILVVSQYFWPETFLINDLVTDLVKKGHEVSVLTGKPNYPKGKFYEGYSMFTRPSEEYNGAKIYRVPLIPRRRGTGLQLFMNYVSFVFFASIFILFHRKKYDVSLTFAISPIIQIYPALLHKRIYKSRSFLWLQDLWPESVTAAGKMESEIAIKCLSRMVKGIYKNTDGILVQSKAFIPSIIEKGIDEDKIHYIPNWAEDIFTVSSETGVNKFRDIVPEGFIVMFAGNIGEAQDFESIISAAEKTKHIKDIKWVIVGDGRKKKWVENEIIRKDLSDTFFLLGRYPVENMPYFFSLSDVMLLTLKDEEIFSLTIPSKVQSYLAFGKPIASMINGIGNKVIKDANCGFTAEAGDSNMLAENICNAHKMAPETLKELGKNGRKYYREEFDKSTIIEKLLNIFKEN